MVAFDERGALDQVLRGIAAQAKFGEDSEFGAARIWLQRQIRECAGVAFEIADCGIELGEGNLH